MICVSWWRSLSSPKLSRLSKALHCLTAIASTRNTLRFSTTRRGVRHRGLWPVGPMSSWVAVVTIVRGAVASMLMNLDNSRDIRLKFELLEL